MAQLNRLLCLILLLFIASSGVSLNATAAPTISLGDVELKKTIDKRNDLTPGAWRMLVFFARGGKPEEADSLGHAYVAALTFREDTESFVSDSVFGLYPIEVSKYLLNEVPGVVAVTSSDKKPDAALLVWVNPEQHQSALEIRDRYQREGTWQLIAKDCVSMMADIVAAIGLTPPGVLKDYPYDYLTGLIDNN